MNSEAKRPLKGASPPADTWDNFGILINIISMAEKHLRDYDLFVRFGFSMKHLTGWSGEEQLRT